MTVAVVTGASKGIGYAITNRLLAENFKVYGISRDRPEISNLNFIWLKADLLVQEDIAKLNSYITEGIDLLVNNAGDFIGQRGLEFNNENFEKQFGLNFKAPILVTQNLKPKLNNSLVINISSISDRIPGEECGLYCASKAALNLYFDCIALEERRMKFFHILPSYVDTPLLRRLWEGEIPPFDWEKIIKPEHIADLVNILSHKLDKYESGTRFVVVTDALKEDLVDLEKVMVFNPDLSELSLLK